MGSNQQLPSDLTFSKEAQNINTPCQDETTHSPVGNVFTSFCSLSKLFFFHVLLLLAQYCKYLNGAAEKQGILRPTYHDGSTVGVLVNMLVAQVEHKRGSAVEEGQHADADIKLRWGRVVSRDAGDSHGGSVVLAVGNITQILRQPVVTQVVSSTPGPRREGKREEHT